MADRDKKQWTLPAPTSEPQQPPPFERKLQFHPLQLIGVPLLMVLPILALFGVFGETFTTISAESGQLAMRIEYPTRERYKMLNDMRVTVTNLSDQSPVTVTVSFDRDYLDNFSNVTFTPSAERITADGVDVALTEMKAGETQAVNVAFQGERYWRHTGVISASLPGGEPVQLSVGTMVYP